MGQLLVKLDCKSLIFSEQAKGGGTQIAMIARNAIIAIIAGNTWKRARMSREGNTSSGAVQKAPAKV